MTSYRPPVRPRVVERSRRLVSAMLAAALVLVGAVAVVAGPQAAPAAAAPGQCPEPGEFPGIGNLPPVFTDNNVAVYAGGNYQAVGAAAESEGLLLVRGDATFDKAAGGIFNVGTVGVGSQIAPDPGALMLAVGGDLTIGGTTRVEVGAGLTPGGAVQVGGAVAAPAGQPVTNGAPLTAGMGQAAAMAPHADFQDVVVETSAGLATATVTGTAERSGGRVTFTSTSAGELQAFSIAAADLTGASEFFFEGVPADAAVVVNVVGGPVAVSATYVSYNGVRVDDLTSSLLGEASARVLWNFTDAAQVDITGSGQFIGSVLAPAASSTITSSTNGRVYVGGDLTTSGSGNEQHNYPWIGPGPFDCVASSSFVVQKTVTGEASADVPAGTTFDVVYSYEQPDGTTGGDVLTVPISGALVPGPTLPEGTVVTVTEADLPAVPGVEWGTPVIQVGGEPLGDPAEFTVVAGQTLTVTVVNTANGAAVDDAVGGFTVQKSVTGDAAGLVPDGTAFLVDWSATIPDGASYDGATSGTLTVLADGTVVSGPTDLPVGTTVSLAEQQPLPAVDGVAWGTPSFAPASPITIVEGAAGVAVTVTNVADAVAGGFTVQKLVAGDAAGLVPDGTAFLVDWAATTPTGVSYDGPTSGTLTVLADGTVTDGPGDLPVGTVVTFTELAPPVVDGVVWGTPVLDPASPVTIVEGSAGVAVTVTNTANAPDEIGGFAVRKVVDGDAAGAVPGDAAFQVAWTATLPEGSEYPGDTTGTLTVLADGTVADGPQDLPAGTVVTFEEIGTLPGIDGVTWGVPEFSPDSVTIGTGTEVAGVSLTNTADVLVGGFSLAKAVEGDLAGSVPPTTAFQVEWTATLPAGFAYDGDLGGTLTLLADGTVVDGPQDLPVGTVVTFTETNLPDLEDVVWGAPTFAPASVTVAEGENALVTLTNTTQDVAAGGFSVAKEVTGDRADLVPADTLFTVTYSYELDGVLVGGTLDVPADGTVVDGPQNLPVGTVVTYTEADLPVIDGVAWGTPTFSPQSVVVAEGTSPLVTVTNTADQAVGGFAAAKAVVGGAADDVPDGTEFTLAWTATLPDGASAVGETSGSLTLRADGTVVEGPQDLPVGTVVTFTETRIPRITGVEWGAPVLTVDGDEVTSVTVTAGDPVLVTLTNTATTSGALATTGSDTALAAGLGVLLLLTGAGLLVARAHRTRRA